MLLPAHLRIAVCLQLRRASTLLYRFCSLITDIENVGTVEEADVRASIALSDEQIANIAADFGQHSTDAEELFRMRGQMSHDEFKAWVNAVGYLQMLQRALAYGEFETTGSLWKQAIIRRCACLCQHTATDTHTVELHSLFTSPVTYCGDAHVAPGIAAVCSFTPSL